jgi:hypothetical protein
VFIARAWATNLIELEADDVRAVHGRHIAVQHVLDLLACHSLVAEEVDREAVHALAGQRVNRVWGIGCDIAKSVCQRQGFAKGAAVMGMTPQAPQHAHHVVGVVELLRDSQRLVQGGLQHRAGRLDVEQRRAEGVLEAELEERIPLLPRREGRERLGDAGPALHRGSEASVRATPSMASPVVEKHQSSALRRLSI